LFADSHSITFDKKHIINEMKARPTFEDFYKKNVVFHYEELEPHIDTELINAVQSEPKSPSTKTSEEDLMKFLESLSMDGAQAN